MCRRLNYVQVGIQSIIFKRRMSHENPCNCSLNITFSRKRPINKWDAVKHVVFNLNVWTSCNLGTSNLQPKLKSTTTRTTTIANNSYFSTNLKSYAMDWQLIHEVHYVCFGMAFLLVAGLCLRASIRARYTLFFAKSRVHYAVNGVFVIFTTSRALILLLHRYVNEEAIQSCTFRAIFI